MSMKVLLTGAAGRLGRYCVADLLASGLDVLATDRSDPGFSNHPISTVDLLDRTAVTALCRGVDAVVHLGNHPSALAMPRERIFHENVAMNMNVFQGALEHGVHKIIFASSVQVIASEGLNTTLFRPPPYIAYLPLDGDSPAQPSNDYALSKWVGEVMLRDYFAPVGIDAIALRFPALLDHARLARLLQRQAAMLVQRRDPPFARISQGFGALMYADAARLITAVLATALPGFRSYLPAVNVLPLESLAEVLNRYYPNVPRRYPLADMPGLIDISRIEKETRWRPLIPLCAPPQVVPEA